MPLPFRRPQACLTMLLLWGAATCQEEREGRESEGGEEEPAHEAFTREKATVQGAEGTCILRE